MKKIKQLSFVLFIFSVLAFSYLVTSVSAQMGSPDMAAPGMGAPSAVSANPDTVCIPESAKDQARRHGYKCMTPETIERDLAELDSRCKQLIIEGHGTFRAKNPNTQVMDPINMQQDVIERTAACVEKKSALYCRKRVQKGLHIDDDFCFPIAERFCGGTEDIRIKTDGSQHELGRNVKLVPELCAHYEIVPTQAAAIKKLQEPSKAQKSTAKQIRGEEKRQRRAQKAAAKRERRGTPRNGQIGQPNR